MDKGRVVLLFSGGIDSTVLYHWLINADYDVFPIHINYGQRTYLGEMNAIREIAKDFEKLNRPPLYIDVPGLRQVGSGSLVGEIKTNNYSLDEWFREEFFPNRNMILISIAASYAYKLNISNLAIGVVGENSYNDTRSSFIKSIASTLSESLSLFEIIAPFVDKSREIVINEARRLKVPIEKTFSCNCLGERHCLLCSSCLDRQHALELLGKQNEF
ncbi:7-cyano-7-deazaguanine synthase [Paenibacillus azoreducens]|uniref:7-cyano-7-deazaguanine synthase n=1 Tax=Paenibacillus azoreducens TaxID=116718 RepID=A0A919YCS3_9BACL|nr:7-cyano-7-deazaguanine synthase [Paenibacillus azoreducens]GIO46818.1 7-cyano-7-deazaguanine synthase [Paenibacillus azoreducens]